MLNCNLTRQVWDWWVHQERFLQLHALEADLAKAQAWSLRQERRRQGVRLDRNFYLGHVLTFVLRGGEHHSMNRDRGGNRGGGGGGGGWGRDGQMDLKVESTL